MNEKEARSILVDLVRHYLAATLGQKCLTRVLAMRWQEDVSPDAYPVAILERARGVLRHDGGCGLTEEAMHTERGEG